MAINKIHTKKENKENSKGEEQEEEDSDDEAEEEEAAAVTVQSIGKFENRDTAITQNARCPRVWEAAEVA